MIKRIPPYSSATFWCALLGCALWLAFLAMLPPVWGSSEAREAHVVSLMHSGGEYVLPLRNGLVPSKPPLFHWVGAALMQLLPITGITAARWVSVLAATLLLAQLYLLAGRLAALCRPNDRGYQTVVRWLAPALLSTSYGFVTMATDARVDMCFAALVVAAVVALIGPVTADELRYGIHPQEQNGRFTQFFILCGLATLAKGPLGVVLGVLCGGCWHLATRGFWGALRIWCTPRIGWIFLLLLAIPWYVLAALKGGEGFVGRQLLFENIQRLFGGEFVNAQPWYFYVEVTIMATFPWSILFLLSSTRVVGEMRVARAASSLPAAELPALQVRRFLFLWYWAGFLLFSCATGKRPSYLLPLLPAVAMQVSLVLGEWIRAASGRTILRLNRSVTALFCLLAGFGIVLVALLDLLKIPGAATLTGLPIFPEGLRSSAGLVQIVLGVLIAIILIFWWRRAAAALAAWPLFTLWFVLLSAVTTLSWVSKGEFKGFHRMAGQILAVVSTDEPLRVVRADREEYFDPLLYYLNRPVELQSPESQGLRCPGFTIARQRWYTGLASESGGGTQVLETQEWISRHAESAASPSQDQRLVVIQCQS